jgi:hypothetical protein
MSSKTYSRIGNVCDRYGVVPMTIRRWMNDPQVAFPQPAIRVGDGPTSHRLWDDDDLDEFDRRGGRAERGADAA